MKGDYTRFTFRPDRNYTGVRMQQGRVQLDADWNEQVDIQAHAQRLAWADLIGPAAAAGERHFKLLPSEHGIVIGAGRYYVDGLLCENHQDVLLTDQPDLRAYELPAQGDYVACLDAWDEHVTALEDPQLREVALGGPDTSTRTRRAWQVRLVSLPELTHLRSFRSGRLKVRLEPAYQGRTNQLYRVEVHQGGVGLPSFKWSADNASLALQPSADCQIDVETTEIFIRDEDQGTLARIAPGQWIEVTDELGAQRGQPGVLAKVALVEGNRITVARGETGILWHGQPLQANGTARTVRVWDGYVHEPTVDSSRDEDTTFLRLRHGVEVSFEPDRRYRGGDFWLIPLRTASPELSLEEQRPREPDGITHHYAELALLSRALHEPWEIYDLRKRVTPVSHTPDEVPGLRILAVRSLLDGAHLRHDGEVPTDVLESGFRIECNDTISSPVSRATCHVSVDVPGMRSGHLLQEIERLMTRHESFAGFPGYWPMILEAEARIDRRTAEAPPNGILWRPTTAACAFLHDHLRHMAKILPEGEEPRLLLRWTVKGEHIFKEVAGSRYYLDGRSMGHRDAALLGMLPHRDSRAGSTFELWFWVVLPRDNQQAE